MLEKDSSGAWVVEITSQGKCYEIELGLTE